MIGFDLPICFWVVVDFLFLNLVTREICEIYANLSESKLHALTSLNIVGRCSYLDSP